MPGAEVYLVIFEHNMLLLSSRKQLLAGSGFVESLAFTESRREKSAAFDIISNL
jgi:hypothetical protein